MEGEEVQGQQSSGDVNAEETTAEEGAAEKTVDGNETPEETDTSKDIVQVWCSIRVVKPLSRS